MKQDILKRMVLFCKAAIEVNEIWGCLIKSIIYGLLVITHIVSNVSHNELSVIFHVC